MSDSTKERFYFIQNKFIWSYFYTIGDYRDHPEILRGKNRILVAVKK